MARARELATQLWQLEGGVQYKEILGVSRVRPFRGLCFRIMIVKGKLLEYVTNIFSDIPGTSNSAALLVIQPAFFSPFSPPPSSPLNLSPPAYCAATFSF